MTKCGKLVVLDKETLEKANVHKDISKVTYNDIKDINVSSAHPLGYVWIPKHIVEYFHNCYFTSSNQFGEQKILTLDCLVKIVEPLNDDVFVILHATCGSNAIFIEKLKQAISTHEPLFTKKFILCSNSPIMIYKVSFLMWSTN